MAISRKIGPGALMSPAGASDFDKKLHETGILATAISTRAAQSFLCLPTHPDRISNPPERNCFGQPMFIPDQLESAVSSERRSHEENEMRLFPRTLAAAILIAGCCLSIPAATVLAQSPQPGPSASAPDLSDQKLSAVAAALERLTSLQKDYRERIAEAEAPAEKDRIVAEAHNEFTKAVTEQGLSVEEYASILDLARDDAALRDKLLRRIRPSDK